MKEWPPIHRRLVIPRPMPKLSTEEANRTYCSECGAAAGQPCLYLLTNNLNHPLSTSPRILAERARVSTPTRRPHNSRHYHPAYRLRLWLTEHAHILWETP